MINEDEKYNIIQNYYICPICHTGYRKPFGEIKLRPIRKCRKCNKIIKMIVNQTNQQRVLKE